jgi:hypothetical protein
VIKKIICLICALLLCCSVTVLADSEFLVYGEDDIDIFCQAFDMDAGEIKYYLSQNNITYLAINGDNTKQIKRNEITDAFSQKVVDFSVLEDSEILNLANQISGFENSKGQVVTVGDIKLLKTEVKTKDSGGEYVLTQFVTVKGGKKITLSFFTAGDGDRAYIETVLKEQFPKEKDFTPFLIGGTVALSIAILVVIVLIILEFRKKED